MLKFEKDKYIEFSLISALFLIIFLVNLPLINIELMQPDSSGYLDIGRNLFTGNGANISYNLNQYWPGEYHPFLPYIQPIYGIIAGLAWLLFGLKIVIGLNILLHAVNCVLLYKILKIHAERLTSFFIALFMGFSVNLVFSAMAPLTEPLNLFFLLLAIFIYLKYNAPLLVGIILAISCLVRVNSLYNALAFIIALIMLKGFSKEVCKEYLKVILGFLVIFLSYEAFCYVRYGVFYPEYLIAAKIYRSAEIYPGAFYKYGIPVLNMPPINLGMDAIAKNAHHNLIGLVDVFRNIKFVFVLAPLYVIFDLIKRKSPLLTIFFFQGACIVLGHVLGHAWSPIYEFNRFSVIPFVTLGSIGFLSLKEITDKLFSKRTMKTLPVVFIVIIFIFVGLEIKDYIHLRSHFNNVYLPQVAPYRKARDQMYEWIRTNTGKDALIASNLIAEPFLLERPFVSLPPGKAFNEKNVDDFLKIYQPEYVLTDNDYIIDYLSGVGFKELMKNDVLILLKK